MTNPSLEDRLMAEARTSLSQCDHLKSLMKEAAKTIVQLRRQNARYGKALGVWYAISPHHRNGESLHILAVRVDPLHSVWMGYVNLIERRKKRHTGRQGYLAGFRGRPVYKAQRPRWYPLDD